MDHSQVVELASRDPQFAPRVEALQQVLQARGVTPDILDQIEHTLEYVLENPEKYSQVRADAIARGFIDEEDAPEQFDPQFITAILIALYAIDEMSQEQGFCSGGQVKYAEGGLSAMAEGVTGRSDDIDARLSDGEYVIDAETVALLGDGSTDAGARKLDQMRAEIRRHKGGALAQGEISPDALSPLEYIKEIA